MPFNIGVVSGPAPRKKSGLPPKVGGDKPHMAMIIAAIPKGGPPGGGKPGSPFKRKPVPPTRAPLPEPDEPDMDELPDEEEAPEVPGGGGGGEDYPILPEAVSYRSEQETCGTCVHMQDDGECAPLHIPVSPGDGCNLFTDASGRRADESAEQYEPGEAGEEEMENEPAYR